jgi:hypothetical protein
MSVAKCGKHFAEPREKSVQRPLSHHRKSANWVAFCRAGGILRQFYCLGRSTSSLSRSEMLARFTVADFQLIGCTRFIEEPEHICDMAGKAHVHELMFDHFPVAFFGFAS